MALNLRCVLLINYAVLYSCGCVLQFAVYMKD